MSLGRRCHPVGEPRTDEEPLRRNDRRQPEWRYEPMHVFGFFADQPVLFRALAKVARTVLDEEVGEVARRECREHERKIGIQPRQDPAY